MVLPVRSHRHSAIAIMRGKAMPIAAKMMWKPRDMAICERAAIRSVMIPLSVSPHIA